jgi:hypothetical protein
MIAIVVLAAQYAGTLDVFDTTRIDARSTQPLPILQSPPREIALAGDVSTLPTARVRLNDRRWDYTLTYAPSLAVTDVELGKLAQYSAVNTGIATAAWHNRFWRITVSESASYGLQSSAFVNQYGLPLIQGQATVPGQTTPPGQTAPGQTTAPGQAMGSGQTGAAGSATQGTSLFPFASSIASAGLAVRAGREVTLSLMGGYALNGDPQGKPSAVALGALPQQFGPFGSASVAYALSRTDSLSTLATAQEITTPLGACFPPIVNPTTPAYCREAQPVIVVQEIARHQLSKTTVLSASVGASAAILPLTNEEAWGILPVGGLNFSERLSAAVDPRDASGVTLSAMLAPVVDVRTGLPSNRAQPTGTFGTQIAHGVFLTVTAGMLQSIPIPRPDPSPLTALNGSIDVRVRLSRRLDLNFGVLTYWQRQEVTAVPPVPTPSTAPSASTLSATNASEIGYVSLTARAPTLHF